MPDVPLHIIEIEIVEKKKLKAIKSQANLVLIITSLKSSEMKIQDIRTAEVVVPPSEQVYDICLVFPTDPVTGAFSEKVGFLVLLNKTWLNSCYFNCCYYMAHRVKQ